MAHQIPFGGRVAPIDPTNPQWPRVELTDWGVNDQGKHVAELVVDGRVEGYVVVSEDGRRALGY
jgi:hypothetical protein